MNQDIKRRWVARLQSGQDEQGPGLLHNADGRKCCLGVLCEIAVEDGIVTRVHEAGVGYTSASAIAPADNDDETYVGILPPVVVKWAGLPSANPIVLVDDVRHALAELNDRGTPFTELALIIDAQL